MNCLINGLDFYPENLEIARDSRGMSQSDLAKLSGVPQSTISKIESGVAGVTESVKERIVSVLGYPASFYSRKINRDGIGPIHFHSKKMHHKIKRYSADRHSEMSRVRRPPMLPKLQTARTRSWEVPVIHDERSR